VVVGHGSAANFRFLTVLENASGPLADLSLAMTRTPEVVRAAAATTFTITATNRGPDPATAVTLRSPLRLGAGFATATASQGTCAEAAGLVTCALGTVPPGGRAAVTLRLRPTAPGLLWTTASVVGSVRDPDRSNDGAGLSTTVAAALAVLAVSNAGPSAATAVTAVLALPAGAAWEAAAPSQGSCGQAGGQVTCQLGALDAGSGATITVVVRPGGAGSVEGAVTVAAAEDDPDPTDDAATARTTVEPVPAEGGGGCGCASAGPSGLLGLAVLLLGWGGGRRPRKHETPDRGVRPGGSSGCGAPNSTIPRTPHLLAGALRSAVRSGDSDHEAGIEAVHRDVDPPGLRWRPQLRDAEAPRDDAAPGRAR
jgi:uncharacterized repeat protein (TIGR01451 family)/MYXO-CTERM domain-containing protein